MINRRRLLFTLAATGGTLTGLATLMAQARKAAALTKQALRLSYLAKNPEAE